MKKTGFIQLIFLFYLCSNLFAQTINKFQLEIEKAKNSNDTVALAKAWYNLGKEYDNLQQTENCNKALHQAIYWSELNKNFSTFSSAANYLAANYSYSGNSDSAFIYYKKAIEACILNSDSLKMASILINLGDEYASTGNYLEAANHAIMALRIKETLKDSANLAYFYQKLGEVYKMADENDKWEEYIQKGYRLIKNEKYTNKRTIASIYNDLGGIAEKHGDYDMALNYYDTLISIGKEIEYFNAVGVALSNSATIHKLQGNHEKALDAALQAQKYKTNTSYQQVYDNNLLAELYLETGNSRKALEFAKKAITNENIGNIPDERMRALKIHYQIEKYNRNFEKALLWLEKYKQLSDSIRDKEIRTKIVDLEIAYETEKKENQIELLTTENKLKSQKLQAGIIILTILIVFIILILYIFQIRRKKAQLIQNDLQQQVLRSQMNPHFIFNVLGSIQNFMLQSNNRKASVFLTQFASLIRATLKYSAAETISLSDEIEMLRNYIDLEKMRDPVRFDYSIEINDKSEINFIQIPPMLIQPFIENSIKHGFNNLDKKGVLKINIEDKTEWVEFVIEDNGNGIRESDLQQKKHQSMAMNIFEKRRKLIQQKHKKEFRFEIENLNDTNPKIRGVKITLNIPVLNND